MVTKGGASGVFSLGTYGFVVYYSDDFQVDFASGVSSSWNTIPSALCSQCARWRILELAADAFPPVHVVDVYSFMLFSKK